MAIKFYQPMNTNRSEIDFRMWKLSLNFDRTRFCKNAPWWNRSTLARVTSVDPNATVSFFFTADPQFGWGASYSGNEER